jgi:transposase
MEEWVTIRLLHCKGKAIREISRELKISRNTVRKAIRSDKTPKYNIHPPLPKSIFW